MNNQPKIEAFKSFYQQGNELVSFGDFVHARQAFLKAAEIANDISINSNSYEVRMEYHRIAVELLDYIRQLNGKKQVETIGSKESGSIDEIQPVRPDKGTRITFEDVAGLEEVKDQIRYKVIEPFKNKEMTELFRVEPGARLLLYGPPGTGKTFIARAISGEVDADFFLVNCQDILSKYLGDSSKKLTEIFEVAQKSERAIIFFDEFDALACKRNEGSNGADGEIARLVATFLTLVDGYKKSDTNRMLLLIAATNRPWAIDSAMLRGGRFDTHIYVGLPDQDARLFMVKKVLEGLPMDQNVDLYKLAFDLEGFGGGDITAICDKIKYAAYMRSIKTGIPQNITLDDCLTAIKGSHNMISHEDLERFERFKKNGNN